MDRPSHTGRTLSACTGISEIGFGPRETGVGSRRADIRLKIALAPVISLVLEIRLVKFTGALADWNAEGIGFQHGAVLSFRLSLLLASAFSKHAPMTFSRRAPTAPRRCIRITTIGMIFTEALKSNTGQHLYLSGNHRHDWPENVLQKNPLAFPRAAAGHRRQERSFQHGPVAALAPARTQLAPHPEDCDRRRDSRRRWRGDALRTWKDPQHQRRDLDKSGFLAHSHRGNCHGTTQSRRGDGGARRAHRPYRKSPRQRRTSRRSPRASNARRGGSQECRGQSRRSLEPPDGSPPP